MMLPKASYCKQKENFLNADMINFALPLHITMSSNGSVLDTVR